MTTIDTTGDIERQEKDDKVKQDHPPLGDLGESEGRIKNSFWTWLGLGILFLAIVGLVIGLSVRFTNNNKNHNGGELSTSSLPRPVIIDTDYGAFPDDIFALSLSLQMPETMDIKMVVSTSMDPETSAKCIADHLHQAGRDDIVTAVGKDIHDVSRAGIWIPEDLVGMPLRESCMNVTHPYHPDAVEAMADLLRSSGRDDFVYISLGGMTTIKALAETFPDETKMIKDVVIMGANVCGDKEIYVGVEAPVQETNVATDPDAANFVFSEDGPGANLWVMPVGPGQDSITGENYQMILDAANSGECPEAAALMDQYFEWSRAAKEMEDSLLYFEATTYDPRVSSSLRYDPTAVMMAHQILTDTECDDYFTFHDIPGIRFDEDAYTYLPDTFDIADPVSDVCPTLVENTFSLQEYPKMRPAKFALGFASKKAFGHWRYEMAARLACLRDN